MVPPGCYFWTMAFTRVISLSKLEKKVRKFGSGMVFLGVFASTAHAYDRGVSGPVRGSPRSWIATTKGGEAPHTRTTQE